MLSNAGQTVLYGPRITSDPQSPMLKTRLLQLASLHYMATALYLILLTIKLATHSFINYISLSGQFLISLSYCLLVGCYIALMFAIVQGTILSNMTYGNISAFRIGIFLFVLKEIRWY